MHGSSVCVGAWTTRVQSAWSAGHRPRDAPGPCAALLDRSAGQQVEPELPLRGLDDPALVHVGDPAVRRVRGVVLDQDLDQPGQREQERVADVTQQAADLVGGDLVAQLQHDRGVVAGGWAPGRRGTAGAAPGGSRHGAGPRRPARGCPRPPPRSRPVVSRDEKRTPPVVDSNESSSDTARTAANPTPNRPTTRALAGSSPRLDDARIDDRDATPVGVERVPGVRRDEDQGAVVGPVEPQQQPAGDPGACRGVRRVLRELDHDPVAVVAAGVVLLGVGVLAQPCGRGTPRPQHGSRRAAVPKASAVTTRERSRRPARRGRQPARRSVRPAGRRRPGRRRQRRRPLRRQRRPPRRASRRHRSVIGRLSGVVGTVLVDGIGDARRRRDDVVDARRHDSSAATHRRTASMTSSAGSMRSRRPREPSRERARASARRSAGRATASRSAPPRRRSRSARRSRGRG